MLEAVAISRSGSCISPVRAVSIFSTVGQMQQAVPSPRFFLLFSWTSSGAAGEWGGCDLQGTLGQFTTVCETVGMKVCTSRSEAAAALPGNVRKMSLLVPLALVKG